MNTYSLNSGGLINVASSFAIDIQKQLSSDTILVNSFRRRGKKEREAKEGDEVR